MRIYFFVEGSPLNRIAADVAISLAKKIGSTIVAQFVIDPQRLFEMEGYEGLTGLCGSGVFIETEQGLIPPLTALGESLLLAFTALAEGQEIRVDQFVDVGPVPEEIRKRACDTGLLVLAGSDANIQRAEDLMSLVNEPLLFVQSATEALLFCPSSEQLVSGFVEKLKSLQMHVQIRMTVSPPVGSYADVLVIESDRSWRPLVSDERAGDSWAWCG